MCFSFIVPIHLLFACREDNDGNQEYNMIMVHHNPMVNSNVARRQVTLE